MARTILFCIVLQFTQGNILRVTLAFCCGRRTYTATEVKGVYGCGAKAVSKD